jgi:formylglycine-generating enzyme required for sulfatase activity
MLHDVFLSYASEDKATADAVCSTLERRGIRCWIAPRDVPAGDWGQAILDAIAGSRIMVLILSSHSNTSANVRNEVVTALDKDVRIVPLRIEGGVPTGSLNLHLAGVQWIDALNPPLEQHLPEFAEAVARLLEPAKGSEEPRREPATTAERRHRLSIRWAWFPAILVICGLALSILRTIAKPHDHPRNPSDSAMAHPPRGSESTEQYTEHESVPRTEPKDTVHRPPRELSMKVHEATKSFDTAKVADIEERSRLGDRPAMVFLRHGSQGHDEYLWLKDSSVVVKIPAGNFTMGSNERDEEKPPHLVYLGEYYIDKYEVTNAQFDKFVTETGYRTDAERNIDEDRDVWNDDTTSGTGARSHATWRDYNLARRADHPAVLISWYDAAAYCKWAGKRLPTEAEWEKAARGTDGRRYPWGNSEPDGTRCNYAGHSSDLGWRDRTAVNVYSTTAPVGSCPKGESPYGVEDMAGNVSEWCQDWYSADYYGQGGNDSNPKGPNTGKTHPLRGGGWFRAQWEMRSALRCYAFQPATRLTELGFRCASNLPASK